MAFTYNKLLSSNSVWGFPLEAILHTEKTPFQTAHVIQQDRYKALFIDGSLQTTSADEFIYHEMLVHPAMQLHGEPKTVLVVGNGEGAALREVLKYPSVERLVHVDIDKQLVRLCAKWLPEWSDGAFRDVRVVQYFCDAFKFLKKNRECYDVIILDLPEPEPQPTGVLGDHCYSDEFFALVASRLNDDGMVATHGGPIHFGHPDAVVRVNDLLHQQFASVEVALVPEVRWSFFVASPESRILTTPTTESYDVRHRYYNWSTHMLFGCVPTYLMDAFHRGSR